MDQQIFVSLALGVLTTLGAVWSLAIWITRQFSNTHGLVYKEIEKLRSQLTDKIEYHERHDDARFSEIRNLVSEIRNSIWEIRLRLAARDGLLPLEERKIFNETRPEQS